MVSQGWNSVCSSVGNFRLPGLPFGGLRQDHLFHSSGHLTLKPVFYSRGLVISEAPTITWNHFCRKENYYRGSAQMNTLWHRWIHCGLYLQLYLQYLPYKFFPDASAKCGSALLWISLQIYLYFSCHLPHCGYIIAFHIRQCLNLVWNVGSKVIDIWVWIFVLTLIGCVALDVS